MTFWTLIMVCINGAQGCTYSSPPTLSLYYQGSYATSEECAVAANAIDQRFGDPDIYGVCFEVGAPRALETDVKHGP
jgi:hypothetical protein